MQFDKKPYLQNIIVENLTINPVKYNDTYNWLGFNLSYGSTIEDLVKKNLEKKMVNIGKFYAWLQINMDTPFKLKIRVLYGCFLPSLLYSCEAWGNELFTEKIQSLSRYKEKCSR